MRSAKFIAPVTYTKRPLAGITLYQNEGRQNGLSIEEMLDELEKSDILSARKELLLGKLRERGVIAPKMDKKTTESNRKRYLVDSDSGKITVDEEDGELTYKDAQLVSASIKSKGDSGIEQAISLLTALKTLTKEETGKIVEKPKEYFVDPDTGVIEHDPENGEYTLAEARPISQSILKARAPKGETPAGFVVDDGEVRELKPGEPIVIKKTVHQPAKTYFLNENQELVEQEAGKPIVIKVQGPSGSGMPAMLPFPVMGSDGQPVLDKEGKPVYANLEPMMKYLGFLGEQRRADERHNALMGLAKTVRENVSDGVSAIKTAAAETKRTGKAAASEAPQVFECGQCHTQFKVPQGDFEKIVCPGCQYEYTKEALEST